MAGNLKELDTSLVSKILGTVEVLIVLTMNLNAGARITKTELINHMEYHHQFSSLTIRKAIDGVIESGLITVTDDPHDKRLKLLSANPQSSATLKKQWIDLINQTFPN